MCPFTISWINSSQHFSSFNFFCFICIQSILESLLTQSFNSIFILYSSLQFSLLAGLFSLIFSLPYHSSKKKTILQIILQDKYVERRYKSYERKFIRDPDPRSVLKSCFFDLSQPPYFVNIYICITLPLVSRPIERLSI